MKISLYRCQIEKEIVVCAFKIIHTTCQISVGDKGMSRRTQRPPSSCVDFSPDTRVALGLGQLCLRSPRLKDSGVLRVPSCSCFCVQGAAAGLFPTFSEPLWHFLKTMHDCFNLSPQRRASLATSQFPFGSASFDSYYGLHVSTGPSNPRPSLLLTLLPSSDG